MPIGHKKCPVGKHAHWEPQRSLRTALANVAAAVTFANDRVAEGEGEVSYRRLPCYSGLWAPSPSETHIPSPSKVD